MKIGENREGRKDGRETGEEGKKKGGGKFNNKGGREWKQDRSSQNSRMKTEELRVNRTCPLTSSKGLGVV